ncbi:MAG: TetR/AcrR family transcriptional regulator [Clostridia bacterium]|nr:TetR/AcrR family transcriptional regulator [Clostridia bacterium]
MRKESRLLIKEIEDNFNSSVGDGSKRKIIENALKVFSKKGLAATRISDIALQAGFSQGFIYNHFKSKDDIFIEIVRLASSGGEYAVKQADKLNLCAADKIFCLTEAMLSEDSLSMEHFRLILLQATTGEAIPEQAIRIAKESAPKPIQALMKIIQEGQVQGDIINDDPIILAIAYFSFIQGLVITKLQTRNKELFPDAEMVLRFMRKKPADESI